MKATSTSRRAALSSASSRELLRAAQATKRRVIRQLKKLLDPHLQETGYREGPVGQSKPLRAWVPRENGRPTCEAIRLRNMNTPEAVLGFTDTAVITDMHVGLYTQGFGCFGVEDLLRMLQYVETNVSRESAVA